MTRGEYEACVLFTRSTFTFEGSLTRSEWVKRLGLIILLKTAAFLLLRGFAGLALLPLMIFGFGLHVRRMRDIGWSPWWLVLFPVFSLVFLALLAVVPGEAGARRLS